MGIGNKCLIFFHVICVSAVIGLVCRGIYLYVLDEDVTHVQYHKFHSKNEAVYPSVSLCIEWPALIDQEVWAKFQNENDEASGTKVKREYQNFLDGKTFDGPFVEADIDNLTINLDDYLRTYLVMLSNNRMLKWKFVNKKSPAFSAYAINKDSDNQKTNLTQDELPKIPTFNRYTSYRSFNEKCFTLDTPFILNEKVKQIHLWISPKIFQSKNLVPLAPQRFSVHFHFPYQKMKSLHTPSHWQSKYEESGNYVRKYFVRNVEVLKRRNKRSSPCIEGKYDDKITLRAIKSAGCKDRLTKIGSIYPFCKNNVTFQQFRYQLYKKTHPLPCYSMRSLSEWQDEHDEWHECKKRCLFKHYSWYRKFHISQCECIKSLQEWKNQYDNLGECDLDDPRKQYDQYNKSHDTTCDKVISLNKWKEEYNIKENCKTTCTKEKGSFLLQIFFNDEFYKEIVYVKSFTAESFIGNSGGYLGK